MNVVKRAHSAWFSREGDAKSVKGFLTPQASDFISTLLSYQLDEGISGSLAEIGTYMGRTFVGLALASRIDEIVLGVDLYPPDVADGFRQSLQMLPEEIRARTVAIRQNTIEMQTVDWIRHLGRPARFIHIDGGHYHSAIIADMHLAASFLAPRALVILDDYLHDWYPDLTEGIHDALRASRNIVPIAVVPRIESVRQGGSKLICGSRDGAEFYRQLLEQNYEIALPQRRQICGSEVVVFQGTQSDLFSQC